MEARITAHSQPYRLRERMEEAQIRHGTDVRVDLPGVRVMAFADSWFSAITGAFFNTPSAAREGEVFFCNMGRINVHETLVEGDDHPLPNSVILEGLKVNESGVYDIVNALVRSNGDIRVFVDDRTSVTPAKREAVLQ
ncbi:MAG TPA: hypothetical protein VHJ69_09490 [Gemmatimonadales bacterium]|jgi:hypothetical protein|nr:hypothetical protein [Gemmatimonadales bacterium]